MFPPDDPEPPSDQTLEEANISSSLTVKTIRDELKTMNLSTHGTKDTLVRRLVAGRAGKLGTPCPRVSRGPGHIEEMGSAVGSSGGAGETPLASTPIVGRKRRRRESAAPNIPDFVNKNMVLAYMYYLFRENPSLETALAALEGGANGGGNGVQGGSRSRSRLGVKGLAADMIEIGDLFRLHNAGTLERERRAEGREQMREARETSKAKHDVEMLKASSEKLRAEKIEVLMQIEERLKETIKQSHAESEEHTRARARLQKITQEIDSVIFSSATL